MQPTGGAYYYGPERACQRYDEEACQKSGESHKTVVETLKDMLRQAEYDRDTEKKEPAKFIFSKVSCANEHRVLHAWLVCCILGVYAGAAGV